MQNQIITTQKFHDTDIQVIKLDEDPSTLWFTGGDIGFALGLSEPRKNVHKIFQRHQDELGEFVTVVNLTTEAGLRETRIYSEEGLYLITMFARSQKAKEFRKWVINLVKAYRRGELGRGKAARDRREFMREERLILREQRLFWTAAESIADSIRHESLTLEALDSVPILQNAVNQVLKAKPKRQLTLFPGGVE